MKEFADRSSLSLTVTCMRVNAEAMGRGTVTEDKFTVMATTTSGNGRTIRKQDRARKFTLRLARLRKVFGTMVSSEVETKKLIQFF